MCRGCAVRLYGSADALLWATEGDSPPDPPPAPPPSPNALSCALCMIPLSIRPADPQPSGCMEPCEFVTSAAAALAAEPPGELSPSDKAVTTSGIASMSPFFGFWWPHRKSGVRIENGNFGRNAPTKMLYLMSFRKMWWLGSEVGQANERQTDRSQQHARPTSDMLEAWCGGSLDRILRSNARP